MPTNNPLIVLYGSDALTLTSNEIKVLAVNSNIPFDKPYVDLGISFLMIKASEIVEAKKPSCPLKSLVSESFGEAAIYKYNVCGGVLQ
jgi:hypothetical protein